MSDTETYEFTNELKQSGASEHMIRMGQRQLVKAAVMQQMFCPLTNVILDMRTAVLVMTSDGSMVMDGKVWDRTKDGVVANLRESDDLDTLEVYDGRELW